MSETPPTVQQRLKALNAAIDELYAQLAEGAAEVRITHLRDRLESLQQQEGELIRALSSAPPTGAIAIGLALLEEAALLRAKYAPPPASPAE